MGTQGFDFNEAQMLGIGIAFIPLPIVAVAVRVWAKRLSGCGLMIDDYWIFVSLVLSLGCCVTQLVAAIKGDLGQHQADYPNGQPILDDSRFIVYERCKFAMQLLVTPALGATKISVLCFYLGIFRIVKWFRYMTYVMIFVCASWTIAFFFAELFTCNPPSPFVESFYHKNCYDAVPMWEATSAIDFITDFIILIMPIPLVLGLSMPRGRKLAVLGMFLMGGLVTAFSVTRFVEFFYVIDALFIDDNYADETYYDSPVFFWSVIEASTGVIAACLLTYGPLYQRFGHGLDTLHSHFTKSPSMKSSSRYSKNSKQSNEPLNFTGVAEVESQVSAYKVGNMSRQECEGIMVEQGVYVDSHASSEKRHD